MALSKLILVQLFFTLIDANVFEPASAPKGKGDKESKPVGANVVTSYQQVKKQDTIYSPSPVQVTTNSPSPPVPESKIPKQVEDNYDDDDYYYNGDDGEFQDIVNPCVLEWSCMTRDQRKAAKAMGYDKLSWSTGVGVPAFDDMYWTELPVETQGNATVIGYTQDSWDNPPSYCFDWVNLSDEMKAAASLLGFGRNSWEYSCEFTDYEILPNSNDDTY